MVASHLGIFRSFTVRIVYTEQAIIVAGIRRSALVSVSRNFELLQTERKSRDAGDGRERERDFESRPHARHTRENSYFP